MIINNNMIEIGFEQIKEKCNTIGDLINLNNQYFKINVNDSLKFR